MQTKAIAAARAVRIFEGWYWPFHCIGELTSIYVVPLTSYLRPAYFLLTSYSDLFLLRRKSDTRVFFPVVVCFRLIDEIRS